MKHSAVFLAALLLSACSGQQFTSQRGGLEIIPNGGIGLIPPEDPAMKPDDYSLPQQVSPTVGQSKPTMKYVTGTVVNQRVDVQSGEGVTFESPQPQPKVHPQSLKLEKVEGSLSPMVQKPTEWFKTVIVPMAED